MATHLANESELIAAAQAGNREAFGVLMNSCYAPTYRLAVGIMRNQEDAEDVLQEAMLKAYCNLSKFQGRSRFYTWIVRITINEALMKIRRRHSERQVVLDDVIESERGYLRQEIEDWSNYPEKLFAQRELSGILTDALTRLSPRLSSAFYLRNVEDLSVKETAERLGLSTNGVKSRVSRARSRLRKKLRGVLLTGNYVSRRRRNTYPKDNRPTELMPGRAPAVANAGPAQPGPSLPTPPESYSVALTGFEGVGGAFRSQLDATM